MGNEDVSAVRPVDAANSLALWQPSRCMMRRDSADGVKETLPVITDLDARVEAERRAVPARAQRSQLRRCSCWGAARREQDGAGGQTPGQMNDPIAHAKKYQHVQSTK